MLLLTIERRCHRRVPPLMAPAPPKVSARDPTVSSKKFLAAETSSGTSLQRWQFCSKTGRRQFVQVGDRIPLLVATPPRTDPRSQEETNHSKGSAPLKDIS